MPLPFTLNSPQASDDLRLAAMTATAGLNTLEEMQLQLISKEADLKAEDYLGLKMGVTVELRNGAKRHFNGLVTRFGIGQHRGRFFGYQATVRPGLWFLTRTSNCRIFQELSVPDIVAKVFKGHDTMDNPQFKLFRQYRKRTYCVQYRETDFNFVARLLEEEGICWYFEHTDGSHRMVLVDGGAGAFSAADGYESLPYFANSADAPPDTEYIANWSMARSVQSGKVALTSYDFERPSTSLAVQQQTDRHHAQAQHEQFDFQGDYTQKADGQQLAENELDELQSAFDLMSGTTNAHGLGVGHLFDMARHPRADQNANYLCIQTSISAQLGGHEAGNPAGDFHCSFSAMPSTQQFRPARRTPKPFVQGPQTAKVVGPAGEEIYTDKYGRVKVQFHWDRYGKVDENSSCWMRVSSPWAGKSFGFVQLPRIGQEVVVDFLEGDPDQPLVTGRVYNAEQMPPWDLPANATQSGVLSRSSKGGAYGNANALRFEDKKGSEQVWLHAEKNQDIEVENDETHWVGHDRRKTIDHDETSHIKHDRTETVDNNETITVHGHRTETVDKNETITIHQNRTETVDANETIAIGANRSEAVGGNEAIAIGGNRGERVGGGETIAIAGARNETVGASETIAIGSNRTETVGANESVTVGGNRSLTVGGNETASIGGNQSNTIGGNQNDQIGGDQSVKVGKGRATDVAKDDALKVGKNLMIDAGDSVTIKTGSASITMKKDGTITIKGKDITIDGSGKINVKASGDIVMKGSKILQN